MARQTMFEGLIYDENENPVMTSIVAGEAQYVVDDDGFHRHIDAEYVDRQILSFFLEQLSQNKDMAVEQAMEMMGQDDLLTKAAIDDSLSHISADQIIAQGVPAQARDMLGMFGFRVVINLHGDVVSMEQPAAPEEGE
ncbi:MAG: hypothetical protein KIS95_03720 [Anaerolineae bacterium]|uniref:hypothetical protein n=1 Tax=Promineifilum sp. TaxID=2664178 RepID=UPI001D5C0E7A|nr:hypothetical protein [Anaerolineales bacterium]MCB8933841.1 hypothetical protein [Promineifilum sp.]MCO5181406.1 hypothetical protein [Promineifilum sp.]MCW5846314.1 hypothetical protein [Anaerolineae bacterium]